MKDADDLSEPVDARLGFRETLRSRAEERIFSLNSPELETLGPEETKELVHKLRVHQVELEIQNEELRRAQDEISIAQARYFDLYDMAPVGYCTLNAKGLILESNLTAAALLGVVREALVRKPFSQVVLKEDQDIYYLHHLRLVETGIPQAFELRLRNADTTFWARLNTTTLRDGTNTPLVLIALSDITEHKKAVEDLRQSELRESENRFRKLFEQHSAVKMVLDADTGRIVDANEAAVKFYGWPLEKLKQMNIRQITTQSPEEVEAELKKAALSGSASNEFRHRRADGSIRDVEVFSNKIKSGGRDYLYSIIHDITERVWAEQILKESEARFQKIFQDVPSIAVQGYGPDGTAKYWNRASELLYGYSMQEAVGQNLLDLIIPGEMRGEIEQALRQMTETGQPIPPAELSLLRKDGSRVVVLSSHAVFRFPGREPELFCIDVDLTELRRIEKDLYENEQRLRLFIEHAPAALAMFDRDMRYLAVSNRWLKDYGLGNRDLQGLSHYEVFPQIPEVWKESHRRGLAGEVLEANADCFKQPDGSEIWIHWEIHPWYSALGDVGGIVIFTEDISENKRKEDHLRKLNRTLRARTRSSEAMMRATEETAYLQEVCTIIVEDCGHAMVWIGYAEDDAGRTVRPVAGAGFEDGYLDELQVTWADCERGRGPTGMAIRTGKMSTCRNMLTDPAFEPWREEALKRGYASSVVFPLMTDGHCLGTINIYSRLPDPFTEEEVGLLTELADNLAYGISAIRLRIEHKHTREQLQELNRELEKRVERRTRELQETQSQFLHAEKLSAVGKLSASIAHEFNNPLQGIMSILKGVKKKAILEEEDRELLDAAIGESERMKNLIRGLQDFNRPSAGKKVVMDVHKSLDSLLTLCKNDFKTKRISTVLNYAEQIPHIMAVPDQIKQVFLNLLTNAADACLQRGGVITISTRQEGNSVAVAIKDTGTGIAPENTDLIFQPFYTTKAEVKGTGLGLSICHGIVEQHQGEIRVESTPGEGTTFTVLLPVKGE